MYHYMSNLLKITNYSLIFGIKYKSLILYIVECNMSEGSDCDETRYISAENIRLYRFSDRADTVCNNEPVIRIQQAAYNGYIFLLHKFIWTVYYGSLYSLHDTHLCRRITFQTLYYMFFSIFRYIFCRSYYGCPFPVF